MDQTPSEPQQLGAYYGEEFRSSAFKVDLADYHFQILKDEIDHWNQCNPFTLSRNANSDGSHHRLIIHINTPPLLDRWSLILGDCIHDIRCSLDHLAYALAIRKKLTPDDIKKLQFPISDTPEGFASQIKRHRLKGIEDHVVRQIECFQPYLRKGVHPKSPLTLLRDLDDIDKHRLIHVSLAKPTSFQVDTPDRDDRIVFNIPSVAYGIESGEEIVSVFLKRPNIDYKIRFKGMVEICVPYTWPGGQPDFFNMLQLVTVIRREVNYIIETIIGIA